ncbi:DUF790 family protein [Deinococcus peraridilitoris]|uniref:DUF790 family protein n=1 Tax=Deinococcus peraridilitoris (strain DSM 19664 / LMG 22246 / CIP 109416 / KR-200) TaxID=937777 RepID=L0A659_DEIPD|nr:DUF790 family protein [Deinococcus peraridilitoris]AFZ69373.1 hypothetical protein Deipe_3970 [Deinococcus peraridilitoris DSM 19664]
MLPTELLSFKVEAGMLTPRKLPNNDKNRSLAKALIELYDFNVGERKRTLNELLSQLEEGRSDFKVIRGLSHLLASDHSTFETRAKTEPARIREKVFALAQHSPPSRIRRQVVLEQAATELSDHDTTLSAEDILDGLYADLPENQELVAFQAPEVQALMDRYNLAQSQGALYRAYELVITARRNEPARYKQLFKYLKLFGLMATVEGDADYGFTIVLDGPTSLFKQSTRYGLSMAKFLPALLHVTKWDLTATLKPRKDLAWIESNDEEWRFELTSESGLVSHYKEEADFDSALESAFAERFEKASSDWILEREVDLVPVPGGVIIPDFRLVKDDRAVLLEIVGYWRPDYLKKKFALLKKSGRQDVIIAVSERLNLEKAGVDPSEFEGRVIFFKGVLPPKDVLEVAEHIAPPRI